MITTIIIISIILVISLYTNFNLLKKNERCEDIIKSYENYMTNLSNTIAFSNIKIKEIDSKGTFEGDDEVGFFFKQIKYLQEQLNNFKIQN